MTPYLGGRVQASLPTLSLILVSLSLLINISGTIWLRRYSTDDNEYSYLGTDYPETWPIERQPVLMAFENSLRFRLNSPDGIAEWSSIVPGEGLIYLGPHRRPYTVSMLHQLRCLDIVRDEVVRDRSNGTEGTTALGRHCLNYLKQMVLCRGDVQLESFQYASNNDPLDLYDIYECKDWGAVYNEVEKNQVAYAHWRLSSTDVSFH